MATADLYSTLRAVDFPEILPGVIAMVAISNFLPCLRSNLDLVWPSPPRRVSPWLRVQMVLGQPGAQFALIFLVSGLSLGICEKAYNTALERLFREDSVTAEATVVSTYQFSGKPRSYIKWGEDQEGNVDGAFSTSTIPIEYLREAPWLLKVAGQPPEDAKDTSGGWPFILCGGALLLFITGKTLALPLDLLERGLPARGVLRNKGAAVKYGDGPGPKRTAPVSHHFALASEEVAILYDPVRPSRVLVVAGVPLRIGDTGLRPNIGYLARSLVLPLAIPSLIACGWMLMASL
ncbi:MAG: hypothetical protein HY319_31070 [Armatimonadetes bacterium]|nr:hypothetical protein [Armatimonadota bacterium]